MALRAQIALASREALNVPLHMPPVAQLTGAADCPARVGTGRLAHLLTWSRLSLWPLRAPPEGSVISVQSQAQGTG